MKAVARSKRRLKTMVVVISIFGSVTVTWACDHLQSEELSIRLSPISSVNSNHILLEHLVATDAAMCLPDWAVGLVIGRMETGLVQRIPRFRVQDAIDAHGQQHGRRLVITGPDYVLVKPKSDRLLEPDVVEAARDYLEEAMGSRFDVRNLQLVPLHRVSMPASVAKDVRYVFSWRSGLRPLRVETVWVENWSEGRRTDAFPLEFEVKGELLVYRVVRPVFRLNTVHEQLLEAQYVPIETLSGAPAGSILDGEWQFTRDVAAGTVLMDDMLRLRPAVVNGELVKVKINLERVDVEALSIATTDAQVGEWVRLRSPSSDEFFDARVVGRSLAIVDQ